MTQSKGHPGQYPVSNIFFPLIWIRHTIQFTTTSFYNRITDNNTALCINAYRAQWTGKQHHPHRAGNWGRGDGNFIFIYIYNLFYIYILMDMMFNKEPSRAPGSTTTLSSPCIPPHSPARSTSSKDAALRRVNGEVSSLSTAGVCFNSLLLFSQTASGFPPSFLLLYKWMFNIRRETRGAWAAGRSTAPSRQPEQAGKGSWLEPSERAGTMGRAFSHLVKYC